MDFQKSVDLKGLCCAQPIIQLAKEIKTIKVGEILLVEADKDSMRKDIPAFCTQTGHTLLHHDQHNELLRFWIRKE